MNGLANLADVLENGKNEVHVAPDIGRRAKLSIDRMLDFAKGLDLAKTPVKNEPGSTSGSGIGPA